MGIIEQYNAIRKIAENKLPKPNGIIYDGP